MLVVIVENFLMNKCRILFCMKIINEEAVDDDDCVFCTQ